MGCRVVVEAMIPVYNIETVDEATRITISKTSEAFNPGLKYVEIGMGARTSPGSGELLPALIAANEALVAPELEITAFNVEQEGYASRIVRKGIGQRLGDIPLKVLSIDYVDHESVETDGEGDTQTEADAPDPDGMLVGFNDLIDGY